MPINLLADDVDNKQPINLLAGDEDVGDTLADETPIIDAKNVLDDAPDYDDIFKISKDSIPAFDAPDAKGKPIEDDELYKADLAMVNYNEVSDMIGKLNMSSEQLVNLKTDDETIIDKASSFVGKAHAFGMEKAQLNSYIKAIQEGKEVSPENVQKVREFIDKTAGVRETYKANYDRILNTVPPDLLQEWRNKGEVGWDEAYDYVNKWSLVPFLSIGEAAESVSIYKKINAIQRGEAVSDEDIVKVQEFILDTAEMQARGYSWGGRFVDMGLQLPAFAVEFMATGGLATAAKKGVSKVASKVITKTSDKLASRAAVKAAELAAAGAARTVAMPHRVVDAYGKRRISEHLAITDKGEAILRESKSSPATSAIKAFGDVWVENFTEELGGEVIGKATSKLISKLPYGLKSKLYNAARQVRPNITVREFFSKTGFNGVLPEIGEERINSILNVALGLNEEDKPTFQKYREAIFPGWDQLSIELGLFSIFGGSSLATQKLANKLHKGKQTETFEEALGIVNDMTQLEIEQALEQDRAFDLENIEMETEHVLDRYYEKVFNHIYPIERLVQIAKDRGAKIEDGENPAVWASVMAADRKVGARFIQERTSKPNADGTFTDTGEGLYPIIADAMSEFKSVESNRDVVWEDLEAYLVTNRIIFDLIPRKQLGEGDAAFVNLSEEMIQEAYEQREYLENKYGLEGIDRLEDYAQRIYGFKNRVFDLMVDSGMISQNDADEIRRNNPHHVPFYRDLGEDGTYSPNGDFNNEKFSGVGTSLYRFKGSDKPIRPIFESIITDTMKTIEKADRNRVAEKVVSIGKAFAPDMVRDYTGETIRIDGVEYGVNDIDKNETLREIESNSFIIADNTKKLKDTSAKIISENRKMARKAGSISALSTEKNRIEKRISKLGKRLDKIGDNKIEDEMSFLESQYGLTQEEFESKVDNELIDLHKDTINSIIKAKQPVKNAPYTILQYIDSKGGVKDPEGDLAAMGLNEWHREKPFRRKLIQPDTGRPLDDLALSAWEEGYFPDHSERPDITEMHDLIDRELKGNPVYPYIEGGEREYNIELLADLDQLGVDVNGSRAEIARDLHALTHEELNNIDTYYDVNSKAIYELTKKNLVEFSDMKKELDAKNKYLKSIIENEEGYKNITKITDPKVIDILPSKWKDNGWLKDDGSLSKAGKQYIYDEVSSHNKKMIEKGNKLNEKRYIDKFYKDNKEEIDNFHKNKNLSFKPMSIDYFKGNGKPIYKSPNYNGRQSSEYKIIMVDGRPAYARKSNHWGEFGVNIKAGTEAARQYAESIGEPRNYFDFGNEGYDYAFLADPFGRIAENMHNWTLEGKEEKNTSQAGFIFLDKIEEPPNFNAKDDVFKSLRKMQKKKPSMNEIKARAIQKELTSLNKRISDRIDALDEQRGEMEIFINDIKQVRGELKEQNKYARKELGDAKRKLSFLRTGGLSPQFLPQEDLIEYYKDGQRRFAQVSTGLAAVMKASENLNMPALLKPLEVGSDTLRKGATVIPEFWAANFFKDQFVAALQSGVKFNPIVDTPKVLFNMTKRAELYDRWVNARGAFSGYIDISPDNINKATKELLNDDGKLLSRLKILDPSRASQFFEETTRLAVFNKALELGYSDIRASKISRDATLDFSRRGSSELLRGYNRLTAFFNVGLQGVDKMTRAFLDNPIEFTTRGFAFITIPSIIVSIAGLYGDDADEYSEIPLWQKDLFWNFKVGGEWYSLPKPFGLGQIFGTVPERIIEFIKSEDEESFRNMSESLFSSLSPVSDMGSLIPTGLKPLVEARFNTNLFTDRDIYSRYDDEVEDRLKYKYNTSDTAIAIGDTLNISPAILENTLYDLTGGSGRYVMQGSDYLYREIKRAKGEDVPEKPVEARDVPVLRRFKRGDPEGFNSESMSKFSDNADKAEAAYRTYRKYIALGRNDEAEQYKKDNIALINVHKFMQKQRGIIFGVGKKEGIMDRINAVENSMVISVEDKEAQIKSLKKEMTRVAKTANNVFKERTK